MPRMSDIHTPHDWEALLAKVNAGLRLNNVAVDSDGQFVFPLESAGNALCQKLLHSADGRQQCEKSLKQVGGAALFDDRAINMPCHCGLRIFMKQVIAGPGMPPVGAVGGCGSAVESAPVKDAAVISHVATLIGIEQSMVQELFSGLTPIAEFQASWQLQMLTDELGRIMRGHTRRTSLGMQRESLGLPPAPPKD